MTLPPSEPLPATRQAARLGAFARGLGCAVGIERSCKLKPGRIEAGRFLLSFGADERTARLTGRLLQELSFPAAFAAAFLAEASSARFLHLGYEQEGSGAMLKVYCEGAPEPGRGAPLYTAYKWSTANPGAVAIDEYRLGRGLGVDVIGAVISDAFGTARADLAAGCHALLGDREGRADDLMLLEVERRGGGRRSFDLRVYGGDLRLGDAQSLLEVADKAFDLGDGTRRWLASAGPRILGHISGGRGEDGDAFLTLYFGAEDFA